MNNSIIISNETQMRQVISSIKDNKSLVKEIIIGMPIDAIANLGQIYFNVKIDGNANNIRNILSVFLTEIHKNGINVNNIKFRAIVNSDKEEEEIKNVGNLLGVNFQITKINKVIEEKEEEIFANGASKEIKKEENGQIKNFVVQEGKVVENNQTLTIAEQKKLKLQSLMNDPLEKEKITNMSAEQLDRYLMQYINLDKKVHYMENANDNVDNQTKVGDMANKVAFANDGMYNAELGIVSNAPNTTNSHYVVEQNNEKINVAAPEVTTATISSNNTTTINSTVSNYSSVDNENNTEVSKNTEEQREEEKIYYIDYYNLFVYDNNGEFLGGLKENGYQINPSTNQISKEGKVLGYVDDFKNMGNNLANDKNKPKVRTLYKDTKSNAAFVTIQSTILVLAITVSVVLIMMFMFK